MAASSPATSRPYRDELVIATKAGYYMHPGPYGEWGSRKYLLSSLDASLKRMGIDYVDIFYHHRPDPDTPIEESMMALDQAVRSGRALYAGISNYGPDATREAAQILRDLGTPLLVHQFPVQHVHPRPGARPAGHSRRVRRWLHGVLAARAGHAHRSLSQRRSRGITRHSLAIPECRSRSPTPTWSALARSTPWPKDEASHSRNSPCNGCFGAGAPRRRSSAQAPLLN